MAKLFAVLGGVQDATTLSGRVWIDETCFPVAAKVAVRSAGRSPGARGRAQPAAAGQPHVLPAEVLPEGSLFQR